MRSSRLLAPLALVIVAACGQNPAPDAAPTAQGGSAGSSLPLATTTAVAAQSSPTAQPSPTGIGATPVETRTAAPSTATAAGTGEVLLTLQRSGGLVGEVRTWVVRGDGSVEVDGSPGAAYRLSPEQLAALRAALGSPAWEALRDSYGEPVPDAFEYVFVADGKTVRTYDGAKEPAVLAEVRELLHAP